MGIVLIGGIELSDGMLIVGGIAAALTCGLLGWHFMNKHGAKASVAHAYAADTNISVIKHRIVTSILAHAENKAQVQSNMDRLLAKIDQYAPNILALAQERAQGQITPRDFHMKLREIIKTIATDLGIALKPNAYHVNPTGERILDLKKHYDENIAPNQNYIPPGHSYWKKNDPFVQSPAPTHTGPPYGHAYGHWKHNKHAMVGIDVSGKNIAAHPHTGPGQAYHPGLSSGYSSGHGSSGFGIHDNRWYY